MRAMLATAFIMAGCLHARAPAKPSAQADPQTLRAFGLLVNDADAIDDAAAFMKTKGLRRDDVIDLADRAYWSFMRAGVYAPAAEIAWRFGFKPRAIGLALEKARKAYDADAGAYLRGRKQDGSLARLHAAQWKLTLEIRIACRYGPAPKDAKDTVERAIALKEVSDTMSVLYPLLDEGCPVDPTLRNAIIDHALYADQDAYAIRHGAASDWDDVKKNQFLWHFFYYGDCTDGVKALNAFAVTAADGARIIAGANCEDEIIDSRGWNLSKATAGDWFFAAMRGKKYNLAIELLELSSHGDDGRIYLYQEAVRASGETALLQALKKHVGYHDGFMAYLWELGRFRFIANFSQSHDWQKKAYDKLLELKRWEDAAEAAEYGVSETLRADGVQTAFRAAMADGDFKAGRYFVHRYGPIKDKPGLVTQEMYDQEKDKWYAAKQAAGDPEWMKEPKAKAKDSKSTKSKRKKKRRPRASCSDGDWCP